MSKATHYGTCQACGKEQKLPNGVLSKHGYTVQWSMFSGTCPGAKHKPFEQSKDLIENFIQTAEQTVTNYKKQITRLENSDDTKNVPFRNVIRHRGKSTYHWVQAEVKNEEIILPDGEILPARRYADLRLTDDKSIAKSLRERKIRWIEREIQSTEDYISWQKSRLTDWQPKELNVIK